MPVDSHQSSVVNRQGLRRPVNFREAVTAAVYADQKDKERRAKSVVVSGMVPRRDVDDSRYVHPSSALCMHVDLVSQAPVTAFVHYSLVFHLQRRQAVF